MTQYIFVDCETGGVTTDYALLSLAGVVTDTAFNVKDSQLFNFKLDSVTVTPSAMKLNKIDISRLGDNEFTHHDARIWLDLVSREGLTILAGWNVQFDAKFIQAWTGYTGVHRMLDIQSVYRFVFPDRNASLGKAAAHLGITIAPDHTALTDALATLEIAKKLTRFIAAAARTEMD